MTRHVRRLFYHLVEADYLMDSRSTDWSFSTRDSLAADEEPVCLAA